MEPETFERDNVVRPLISQLYTAVPNGLAALVLETTRNKLVSGEPVELEAMLREFIDSCPGGAYIVIEGIDERPHPS